MKSRLILLFFLIFCARFLQAQDPVYSLSFEHKSLMNPSLIGRDGEGKVRVGSVYRNLYKPLYGNLQASAVTADYSFCNSIIAIGLIAGNETQGGGFLKTNNMAGILGLRKNIKRDWALNAGFQFGLIKQNLDWGNLVFSDQLNPIFGPIYQSSNDNLRLSSKLSADLGFGLDLTHFNYGKNGSKNGMNFGFAMMHATNNTNLGVLTNYVLPRRYTFHGNWIHRKNPNNSANSFQIMARYDQQYQFKQCLLRMNYFFLDEFSLGLGYRGSYSFAGNINSPLFVANFALNQQLNFQVLYEYSLGGSGLLNAGNTFEIGLIFRSASSYCISDGKVTKSRGRNVCPVFNKTKSAPTF
ncbi:MAG: PorP/SprF family type IX secretion system membrane protein [Bacteroidia bacterium]|nr:PorP/SprF family type IX secretion system membrane protein [Bacteroidia bacterium]MCF8427126.1 PorP/SprF family type IX secretion system membrane protein [Bacteroidia bacterium]MCF8447008.1 PorP/SprF family type IX secretion system membrane protein [Bacteroidia bacterium]